MTTSTPLPEQRGCNVPRCGVWPIYKEGLCGSHYMEKHCPREGEYVSKYDPLPEQGGFDEKLDEILRTYTADKEWARTKVENHADYTEHTNECGVCNKMQQLTDQAKAAIRTLVLEEIVGEDERWDVGGRDFGFKDQGKNELRAEQRKKLGGSDGTK